MYKYYPKIRWEIKDDFTEGRIPAANEKVKRLQALRDETAERLRSAIAA